MLNRNVFRNRVAVASVAALACLLMRPLYYALAQDGGNDATPPAEVSIEKISEEGETLILATVTSVESGEPIEDASVSFFVKRTFGLLSLGSDTTLDDGSAAVTFPADIPGDSTGKIEVLVKVTAPADLASVTASAILGGASPLTINENPFPRELWSRRAPFSMMLIFVVLLGGVWCTFFVVVRQVYCIAKGR